MTTRIGLVSDVHSSPVPLRHALEIFERQGVDDIVCAGDIAGYFDTVAPTVELLMACGCKAVLGNHDLDYLARAEQERDPVVHAYFSGLPQTLELEIAQRKILVVHANPPSAQQGGIRLLDPQGEVRAERRQLWRERLGGLGFDVLVVGHTHQVYAEQIGEVFVVNPGSTAFNYSCMILSLPDLSVETFALDGRGIIKCWNFGMLNNPA